MPSAPNNSAVRIAVSVDCVSAERERLEVARVVLGDVHADGDVVRTVDRRVLESAGAGEDAVDEPLGEVGDRVQDAGARPRSRGVVRAEHCEAVVDRAQLVVEEHTDPGRVQCQLLAYEVGIGEGLLLGGVAVLVEQVVAGQAVGDTDQDHAGEQCDEREEQRDSGTQSEGSAPSHRVSVAGGGHRRPSDMPSSTAVRGVHPLPVECQGEEGIPPGQREQS